MLKRTQWWNWRSSMWQKTCVKRFVFSMLVRFPSTGRFYFLLYHVPDRKPYLTLVVKSIQRNLSAKQENSSLLMKSIFKNEEMKQEPDKNSRLRRLKCLCLKTLTKMTFMNSLSGKGKEAWGFFLHNAKSDGPCIYEPTFLSLIQGNDV
jgi:hypothetical protein